MGKRFFIAAGGALDPERRKPPIGGSAYIIIDELSRSALVVDCGAYHLSEEELDRLNDALVSFDESQEYSMEVSGVRFPKFRSLISQPIPYDELDEEHIPNISLLKDMENIFCVATHGHHDHIGALPFLWRQYREKLHIFMTKPTFDICDWNWFDSLRIARREERQALFNRWDVNLMKKQIQCVNAGERVKAGPFTLDVFYAGHILGAIGVLVTMQNPRTTFFFSGDFSIKDQHTVRGAVFPDFHVDFLVTESTYAGKTSLPREQVESQLMADVRSKLEHGGKVLCPALATRVPELFAIFKRFGLADQYSLYIDGAGRELAELYSNHQAVDPSIMNHFIASSGDRNAIASSSTPLVVIAPSGMLAGGHAIRYLKAWAQDPRNLIALSSYQGPCSTGNRILVAPEGSTIRVDKGEYMNLNARVRNYALSGHADGEEIMQTIDHFNPQTAFLVHGDEGGMESIVADYGPRAIKTALNTFYGV